MDGIPPFSQEDVRRISRIVGETCTGLAGTQIDSIFQRLEIEEPEPKQTKRHRIFDGLTNRQTQSRAGDVVIEFVRAASGYARSRWIGSTPQYQYWQSDVNEVLKPCGYRLDDDGFLQKSQVLLRVPTINDNPWDFDKLFGFWEQVNHDGLHVTFDFSSCWFLRQNAVAFLGGLARLVEYRGGIARFDWDSLRPAVGRNLAKNCFRDAFGNQTSVGTGHSIPYREDTAAGNASLMEYLKRMWLGRGWVSVSPALRDAIVGRVWEIYVNAFEHSESPIGVFSCGQHFPRNQELTLTVVDFGVGIPSNVRRFVRNPTLSAGRTLTWAFQAGNTTKPNGMGRGMGLELLKEFVRVNKGVLEVFSHDGYARITEKQEKYEVRARKTFEGTILNVSLRCDDRYYCLQSEIQDTPLF